MCATARVCVQSHVYVCNRSQATGALIGALLGAECGYKQLPADLVAGLAKSQHKQVRLRMRELSVRTTKSR